MTSVETFVHSVFVRRPSVGVDRPALRVPWISYSHSDVIGQVVEPARSAVPAARRDRLSKWVAATTVRPSRRLIAVLGLCSRQVPTVGLLPDDLHHSYRCAEPLRGPAVGLGLGHVPQFLEFLGSACLAGELVRCGFAVTGRELGRRGPPAGSPGWRAKRGSPHRGAVPAPSSCCVRPAWTSRSVRNRRRCTQPLQQSIASAATAHVHGL